ncbi:MAG: hypothetical protein DELT_00574 [Desulfovibrio sp.]
MNVQRILLAFPVAVLLFSGSALAADMPHRTFDKLTAPELDALSKVTHEYYMCVAEKLPAVTGADAKSPQRILATYPEQIRILRQQCRIRLLNVEKILYALDLNPEFITNYSNTLRDDVVYFGLQQMMKKAAEEKPNPGSGGLQQGRKGKVHESGLDILTTPPSARGKNKATDGQEQMADNEE